MGYIYKLTTPEGKFYVGQTVSMRKRLMGYSKYASSGVKQSLIVESMIKYGFENHIFQVLEMNVPFEKLSEREEHWIKHFNSVKWMNPSGLNKNRFDRNVMLRIKNKENFKDHYEGLETWDFKPFTGAEFIKKSIELKKQLTAMVNKRTNRTFPEWSNKIMAEKLKKPILCYDVNGDFIREFDSTKSAVEELGITRSSIKDSLRKGSWSRNAYMFKYWEENYPKKIEVGKVNVYSTKKPVLVLNSDWSIITEYESSQAASEATGISKSAIKLACKEKGVKISRKGYRFVNKEDYDSLKPSETGGGDRPLI